MLRITLFQFRHKELSLLEAKFNKLYSEFVNYDNEATELFLKLAGARSISSGVITILEKYLLAINSQREGLRILLTDLGNLLNSARARAINYTPIQIAFTAFLASIILGIISIYVAYISDPIFVYPVK